MAVRYFMGPMVLLLLFLLPVVGVVLLTLAIRGRATFWSPTCSKCGYDLRAADYMGGRPVACPECGADLTPPKAVNFGRYERSGKGIIAGVGLLVLPFLAYFVLMFALRSSVAVNGPAVLSSQGNAQILAGLPAAASDPWSWRELSSRLKAGRLSNSELDTAMGALIADITATRAKNRGPQPLHWSNDFVKDAVAAGGLSEARKKQLCGAFFTNAITVETRKVVRAGQPIEISISGNAPWDLGGHALVWVLREAKTGEGTPLRLKRRYGAENEVSLPAEDLSQDRHGYLGLEALGLDKLGEQELVFVFDVGAVLQNTPMRGKDGKPGLKQQWPSPLATWELTMRQKILIVPADQLAVQLDTDASHDPRRDGKPLVKQAMVRKATGGVEVVVEWDWSAAPRPPIAGTVKATLGGQELSLGHLLWGHLAGKDGTDHGWGGENCVSIGRTKALAEDVRSLSVLVEPAPSEAEKLQGMDTIWGKSVEIKEIRLQRFDLTTGEGK